MHVTTASTIPSNSANGQNVATNPVCSSEFVPHSSAKTVMKGCNGTHREGNE